MAVVFSCCHCPYVVAWEDRLNEVARDVDGRAGFLAINANAGYLGDSPDEMRRRAEEKSFVFPFLYDESQETATAYGAVRTPEVFVFDSDHQLVYHGAPDSDHQNPAAAEPYLLPALNAALSGTQPEVQERHRRLHRQVALVPFPGRSCLTGQFAADEVEGLLAGGDRADGAFLGDELQ